MKSTQAEDLLTRKFNGREVEDPHQSHKHHYRKESVFLIRETTQHKHLIDQQTTNR